MRYIPTMGMKANIINSIATALCVTVGFSGPLGAQTERLDQLFEQLLEAEPQQVARIEGQIITEFGNSGSASMDLLRRRGEDALEAAEFAVAVEHFTALIDHAPNFAEGYHGRATAYYNLGLIGPAIDDLRQTLVLQPRHLGAMTGVAVILEELERPEDALEIWQQLAAFSPADEEIAAVIERLTTQLAGETL
ncbi:hypothetical protein [Pseudooctadecabacter sp.]|uniref:hypothetical protein n=1 Tax=Pseudooctadecabacter sp. TaxID=1966338 RepID=UPI0035C80DFD